MVSPSSSLCQAAVFEGTERGISLQEFEIPEPAAGEALVRMECCTICGSDLHTLAGRRHEPTPSILGHEIVGRIIQVGDPPPRDAIGQALQVGDRVTWAVVICCAECDRCRQGLPQKCRRGFKYGHGLAVGRQALSGGLAERILLRAGTFILRLPPEIPAQVLAPANCATATIAACLRAAGDISGRRVLILGAGMLGLTATAMCHAQAARSIVVVDPDPRRLERATDFGATATLDWSTTAQDLATSLNAGGWGDAFDVTLELSGNSRAVEAAIALADVGGQAILAGSVLPTEAASIDPEHIVRRCLRVVGVHNYAPADLQTAVHFLVKHADQYPFESLVEGLFALQDVTAALEFAIREKPVRAAIVNIHEH